MTTDTVKKILPYQYRKLPGERVFIANTQGARIILTKAEVATRLETSRAGVRELSSHETMMLEEAWKVLEEKENVISIL